MEQLIELAALQQTLAQANDFDCCAWGALRAANRLVGGALSALPGAARVLRSVLLIRQDAFEALRAIDAEADAERVSNVDSSATVWQAVKAHRRPISVNVSFRALTAHTTLGDEMIADGVLDDGATHRRLLASDATHLYAVPLIPATGRLHGMLLVELRAPSAAAQNIVHERCGHGLQVLASLALPSLLWWKDHQTQIVLPTQDATADDIPVMGERARRAMPLLKVFAASSGTILLTGPTGTGKSTIARWCHAHSERANGPFETVSLTAVAADIQLGEFFGWRRGAFTGATGDHEGAVRRAEGGTLFIDEIDKLSLDKQGALLWFLQTRKYRRLAGKAERTADVRLIVASNQDLPRLVQDGEFLEDLYHRINVLPFELDPLDLRRDEIVPWALHMAHRYDDPRPLVVADGLFDVLLRYEWPGNLRQLDNVVHRACVLAASARGQSTIRLQPKHLEWALALDGLLGSAAPYSAVRQAAAEIARLAVARHRDTGHGLPLKLLEGFAGLCLAAAQELPVSLADAYRAFDQASLVANRNHHKSWKSAKALAERLRAALEAAD